MKFKNQLIEGTLLKRYKRFFADVKIGSQTIVAHVPNSGSMIGCKEPGSSCLVSYNPSPTRKLQYTLEMVKTDSSWVGVNTSHPNKLVKEAFESKFISTWKSYDRFLSEVKINDKSRLDMVVWSDKSVSLEMDAIKKLNFLKCAQKLHFIEVKNVSLAQNKKALFPDAVTERGQKHLLELEKLAQKGHKAEIFFIVQREDCKSFSPADEIDPQYGKILRKVLKNGVLAQAYSCQLSPLEIKLSKPLKIEL